MRRGLQEDESLFPNFAGFADLMSALCLLFIIVAAILLFQYKLQLAELNNIQIKNESLQTENKNLLAEQKKILAEKKVLEKEAEAVPKKFIIPNELNGKVFFKSGEAKIQRAFYNDLNIFENEIRDELNKGNFNFV